MAQSTRCAYCQKQATVWYRKSARIEARGHSKMMNWATGACAEHEGSVAFQALLQIDKPTLIRADMARVS